MTTKTKPAGPAIAKPLTLPEVADRLRVSMSTVRREIARGRLRAFRVGYLYRVRPEDLDAYMKSAE